MAEDSGINLVFKGEIAPGFDEAQVKLDFAKAFKVAPEKAELLFKKSYVVLKRNLSSQNATRLQGQLLQIGMFCQIESLQNEISSPVSTNPPEEPSRQELQAAQQPPVQVLAPANTRPGTSTVQASTANGFHISANFLALIFFGLVGLALVLVFSPFPSLLIKRGFVLGLVFIFLAYRRLVREIWN